MLVRALPVFLLACGGAAPGVRPHDMSAAAHEHAAELELGRAAEDAARYDPDAGIVDPCDPRMASCFTAMRNPTEQYRDHAEQHRRRAAQHRDAAVTLRTAEATACAGVSLDDRERGPFARTDAILAVRPLLDPRGHDKPRLAGTVIVLRARAGVTVESVRRIVACHRAHVATLGYAVPALTDCPLVPRGSQVDVRAARDGIAIEIRLADPRTANEILARSERLSARLIATR